MFVIGGGFDFRIESLEAAIDNKKPDLVVLDGAYLLKMKGDTRTEQAANIFNELKRLANRRELPIVVSSQFNRGVDKNQKNSVGPEKIALTDVAGWNADLIFALSMTEDMRKEKRMELLPMKFREGVGKSFEINWDFEGMNFSERASGADSDADDDEDPLASGGSSSNAGVPDDGLPF
jgi:replicative DNA helicase